MQDTYFQGFNHLDREITLTLLDSYIVGMDRAFKQDFRLKHNAIPTEEAITKFWADNAQKLVMNALDYLGAFETMQKRLISK